MKQRKVIQVLAFVLTLCLTIGALPLYVLADGTEAELPEQITEATNENLTAFQLGIGEKSVAELENMTLSAADIPASISREAVEAKDHVLRLREQEADLNTVIFQNRDGGKTVYLFGSPVKYVDANGNIRDKSTTLVSENVTVNGKTYAHSATDNFFGQYYPTMPQNGVMLAFGPYTVEMTPVITGVLTLRDTTVSDNKVTYNKVFGTGTSLVYTPTLNGVKEDIILSAYTGKSSFSFTLKTNGLAIIQDENDTFLADFEGNKVASLGDVIITDSANHTAYGTMTVVTKTEREEYTVTVNAPTAFLTNPTTVYPVTVDPTVVIDEYTVDGFEYYPAIDDLCIYNGSTNPYLNGIASIGNYSCYGETDPEVEYARMLYKINTDYLFWESPMYYMDASRMKSASLHLYGYVPESSVAVTAYECLESWSDGTSMPADPILWDSHSNTYSSVTTVSSTSFTDIEIDVTNIFAHWSEDDMYMDYGIMLMVNGEGNIDDTDCYYQLILRQTEHETSNTYFSIDYTTFEGAVYINNKDTGKFFLNNGTSSTLTTGVYSTNDNRKWYLRYLGENSYTISPNNATSHILGVSGSSFVYGTWSSTPDDEYKWELTHTSTSSYGKIKNVETGQCLYVDANGNISLGNNQSTNSDWRLCKVSAYVPLTSLTAEGIEMGVAEAKTPTITKIPSNATWMSASDFTWSSSNTSIAEISSSGRISTFETGGKSVITVKHKASGKQVSFDVVVRVLEDGIYHVIDYATQNMYMYVDQNKDIINMNVDLFYNSNEAGKYLWGFTMLDDGTYKITSLFFQTAEYTDNMALTYTLRDDEPTEYKLEIVEYTNVDRQKWIISYTDGIYSLSPKSNDDVNIYIDSVDNTGLLISLDHDYAPAVSYWGGTYGTHTAGEVLNIAIEVDEDVIDAVFSDAVNATQLFYSAIDKWNDKCNNVHIFFPNETAPNNSYKVEYKIGFLDDGKYGEANGYVDNGEVGNIINWEKCIIYLDLEQINNANRPTGVSEIILKQQVITHEMGHALKLTHPFHDNSSYLILSVMNNFDDPTVRCLTNELTAYDIYALNQKWG